MRSLNEDSFLRNLDVDALECVVVAGIVVPIYEYQCQSCQKVFEFIQKMSDDPMTECEECKGELSRMISQSAFHLKGGGWYKDLYSSVKKDDGSTSGSGSSGSDGAASSASSDSSKSSETSDSAKSSSSDAGASSSTTPTSSSPSTSPASSPSSKSEG